MTTYSELAFTKASFAPLSLEELKSNNDHLMDRNRKYKFARLSELAQAITKYHRLLALEGKAIFTALPGGLVYEAYGGELDVLLGVSVYEASNTSQSDTGEEMPIKNYFVLGLSDGNLRIHATDIPPSRVMCVLEFIPQE